MKPSAVESLGSAGDGGATIADVEAAGEAAAAAMAGGLSGGRGRDREGNERREELQRRDGLNERATGTDA